jgi:hypothetical protein
MSPHLDQVEDEEYQRGRIERHVEDGHDGPFVMRYQVAEEEKRQQNSTSPKRETDKSVPTDEK